MTAITIIIIIIIINIEIINEGDKKRFDPTDISIQIRKKRRHGYIFLLIHKGYLVILNDLIYIFVLNFMILIIN